MNRLASCSIFLFVAGCTQSFSGPLDLIFGNKSNNASLHTGSIEVSATPQTFEPESSAEIVGKKTFVCIKLDASEQATSPSDQLDKREKIHLHATVRVVNGNTYEFKCPVVSGRREELSACVQPSCSKPEMPMGGKVLSVTISAEVPIHGRDAFWMSTNVWDRRD